MRLLRYVDPGPAPPGFHFIFYQTALMFDVVHKLVAEMLDEAFHRQRRGVAEGADRAAGDVVGDVVEERQVLHAAAALLDAMHDPVEPAGALAAGRPPARGFPRNRSTTAAPAHAPCTCARP